MGLYNTTIYNRARVPVIPLDYTNKFSAVKKELMIDYKEGNIYVVSAESKERIFDITRSVSKIVTEEFTYGDNLIVNIEGVGEVNLAEFIEFLDSNKILLIDMGNATSSSPIIKYKEVLYGDLGDIDIDPGNLLYCYTPLTQIFNIAKILLHEVAGRIHITIDNFLNEINYYKKSDFVIRIGESTVPEINYIIVDGDLVFLDNTYVNLDVDLTIQFTYVESKLYYDSNNLVRYNIPDSKYEHYYLVEDLDTSTTVEGKIYLVSEYSAALIYKNGDMLLVKKGSDITNIIGIIEDFIPATMTRSGMKIAPRSLASAVFTDTGETVDEALKRLGRVTTSVAHVIATVDNQKVFNIPFPIENYLDTGNMLVNTGSITLDPRRYIVTNDILTLHPEEPGIEVGRSLTFIFIFTTYAPGMNGFAIDGTSIVSKSIPTNKLTNVIDRYNVESSGHIPSSKALYDMYTSLTNRIDLLSGNLVMHISPVDNSTTDLKLQRPGFRLTDGTILYIKLIADIEADATITINNSITVPIYIVPEERIKSGMFLAGETISLQYDLDSNKYYILNGGPFKINVSTYIQVANGGESVFNLLEFISDYNFSSDRIEVYQNGLKLFESINYDLSVTRLTLKGYLADKGDQFVFQISRIARI